jgi:hypothetical protein
MTSDKKGYGRGSLTGPHKNKDRLRHITTDLKTVTDTNGLRQDFAEDD